LTCIKTDAYMRVGTAFEAVPEPARRAILDLLIERRLAVGELVDQTASPTTSRHPRILRGGRVGSGEDAEARRLYELSPEGISEIECWLAPYRRMWRGS
jgi:DNA-binding transcriptional ArsR family regulator